MHNVRRVVPRLRQFSSFTYSRPVATLYRVQIHPQNRRCVHHLRQLPYNIEQGLGNFLSPAALRMIAVDYQQGLLTRLNEQVRGTGLEAQSVTDTVISTASHRQHALAFNYASQALNNSFFLDCLRPPPPPPATNEDELENSHLLQEIRLHFGSLAQLQSTFSAAAMGMINSGWVWLVSDENGHLEVVATFGAGTLLVRSRTHMRTSALPILGEPLESRYKGPSLESSPYTTTPLNASTWPPHPTRRDDEFPSATSPASGMNRSAPGLSPSTPSRELHTSRIVSQQDIPNVYSSHKMTPSVQAEHAASGKTDPDQVGDVLTPILCVSVQEHAWVGAGYGVWGKEEYLKQFWTVVNWGRVQVALDKATQNK